MPLTTSATSATSPTSPTPRPRPLHPLMTRAEFARALRVDPTTVDSWRRAGRLHADEWVELPGGTFRYRRAALARILGVS